MQLEENDAADREPPMHNQLAEILILSEQDAVRLRSCRKNRTIIQAAHRFGDCLNLVTKKSQLGNDLAHDIFVGEEAHDY